MIHARNERGFALLIVLWSVALLALLGTGISGSGRMDVQLAGNLRSAAEAEAAADGAVFEAVFHLLDPARPWQAGAVYEIEVAGARVTLRVEDESGKINPNTAPPELLRALLTSVGADAATADHVAAAIADWRFPGTLPRPNGAKAPQYRAAGLPYGPPNAPFESLGEIGAVLGMNADLLARLTPHLSLYNDRDPSPQTADAAVTRALAAISGRAPPSGPAPPLRTVTIVAAARTAAGSRFTRRASLRLGADRGAPLFEVLFWSGSTSDIAGARP